MAKGDLRGTLTASVNSVTNPTNATGSVAVSVDDLVFVTMAQQTNLTASSVTDNLGNTYNAVNAGTDGGTVTARSFYSHVTNAGTLTQVSVAATASTNDASVVASVIEGPFLTSPLDANPANGTDATTPFACPATGALAQASEVVMSAIAVAGNQTVAATSPSLISGTVARANASCGNARRVVSSTSSVTPEFTGTSATAVQVTASFKLDTTVTADTAETMALSDAPSTVLVTSDSTAESMSLADATDWTGAVFDETVNESVSLADGTLPTMIWVGETAESVALSDAPTAVAILLVDVSESVALADAPSGGVVVTASVSEAMALSDAPSGGVNSAVDVSEAMALIDFASATGGGGGASGKQSGGFLELRF